MAKVSNIKPISYFKAHASEMLDTLRETQVPYVITQNGEAAAVLIEPRQYDSMVEAIALLKLLQQGESDVRNKRTASVEQVRQKVATARKKRND